MNLYMATLDLASSKINLIEIPVHVIIIKRRKFNCYTFEIRALLTFIYVFLILLF